jgi:hypothetical protein
MTGRGTTHPNPSHVWSGWSGSTLDQEISMLHRHVAAAFALALAALSMLPALASARLVGNHNQTALRD